MGNDGVFGSNSTPTWMDSSDNSLGRPLSSLDSWRTLLGLGDPRQVIGRKPVPGTRYQQVKYDDGSTEYHNESGELVPNAEVASALRSASQPAQTSSTTPASTAGQSAGNTDSNLGVSTNLPRSTNVPISRNAIPSYYDLLRIGDTIGSPAGAVDSASNRSTNMSSTANDPKSSAIPSPGISDVQLGASPSYASYAYDQQNSDSPARFTSDDKSQLKPGMNSSTSSQSAVMTSSGLSGIGNESNPTQQSPEGLRPSVLPVRNPSNFLFSDAHAKISNAGGEGTLEGDAFGGGRQKASQSPASAPTLTPYSQSILTRFDTAPIEPNDKTLPSVIQKVRPIIVRLLQMYPDIRKAPPGVRAALYALTQLGDKAYGHNGNVTDPVYTSAGPNDWKCNLFVAKCWARGAGIGYQSSSNPSGYSVSGYWHHWPPTAAAIHNGPIPNFRPLQIPELPQIGDLVGFLGSGQHGHSGIYLGGGLMIYAGNSGIKLGTVSYVLSHELASAGTTYQRYNPRKH